MFTITITMNEWMDGWVWYRVAGLKREGGGRAGGESFCLVLSFLALFTCRIYRNII